jgi:ABC-type Mn2+/Zn2+ transport system permease subunit
MTLLHQLDSPLLGRALLEAILVGALCGTAGAHVLLRRLPFFTLALSHATFPGVVLASIAGMSPYLGGAGGAVGLVVAVAVLGSARRLDASAATGVALSGAFGLGVLLQSARPGASKDLAAFLVGDVFTVTPADLVTTALVGALVVGVLALVHKEIVFGAFDPGGAAAAGYPVLLLDLGVLAVVALTVVTSVPAVGTILVVSLLVTPPLTARLWTDRVGSMMGLSAVLGGVAGLGGIAASAQWGVAGGAAITLTATALLVLSGLAVPARAALRRVTTARRRRRVLASP